MHKTDSKICIVSLDNQNRIPYISYYERALKSNFDVVLWNRNQTEEYGKAQNYYCYNHEIKKNSRLTSAITKLMGYIGFSRYVSRILKAGNYKGVIAMTGNCGTLIYNSLKKRFKGKYIIEIRDYWMEKHKWYYRLESKAIGNSYATVISSDAYKCFLPAHDYILAHNLTPMDAVIKESFKQKPFKKSGERIVISCIGGVKDIEYDKDILQVFKNDPRFLIRYIGRGYEDLREFCSFNGIENAYIEGLFPQEKTLGYYEDTDIVMNLYGNNTPELDFALSNKLYYAALLSMPILVCSKTHMATVAEREGIGFVFEKNDPAILDKLFDYYMKLDRDTFIQNCQGFIDRVSDEMNLYLEMIREFEDFVVMERA